MKKLLVFLFLTLCCCFAACNTINAAGSSVSLDSIETTSNAGAIERFQEYLRINTAQPDPDYEAPGVFLQKQAERLGLPFERYELVKGKPIFFITWEGKNKSAPAIMLNSHMDVVPVEADKWLYDPFSAHKTETGDIYARGSQDMKCVGMQYLEAIEALKKSGFVPTRTVVVSFVPDEEVGGHTGMELLVKDKKFTHEMNIGFVLDEGLASPTHKFMLYYGERAPWWIKFTTTGQPGHGSMLLDDTAPEKMSRVIAKAMEFRASQVREMKLYNKPLGEVTTINWTYMKGGHSSDGKKISVNVIPSVVEVTFDIRIPPATNLTALKEMFDEWAAMDEGISYDFIQYTGRNVATELTENNPYWVAFKKATDGLGMELDITVFPAATDSRYVRGAGYPALGFSPMNFTPVLLHQHNEYLNENVYLRGIKIYEKIISSLATA